MKKLIIFLLDLILPLAVTLFCFAAEPWCDGNRTIQGVMDNINGGKILFVILLASLLLFYWRSPLREQKIFTTNGLKWTLLMWLLFMISMSVFIGLVYLKPQGKWEGVEETPYIVRIVRCSVITLVMVFWKYRMKEPKSTK